jgi:hypothetical protein
VRRSSAATAAAFGAAGLRTRRLRGRLRRATAAASLRDRRLALRRRRAALGLRPLRLLRFSTLLRRRGATFDLRRLPLLDAAAAFSGRLLLLCGRSLPLRRRPLLLTLAP